MLDSLSAPGVFGAAEEFPMPVLPTVASSVAETLFRAQVVAFLGDRGRYVELRADWDWYLVGELNTELPLRPTARSRYLFGNIKTAYVGGNHEVSLLLMPTARDSHAS